MCDNDDSHVPKMQDGSTGCGLVLSEVLVRG